MFYRILGNCTDTPVWSTDAARGYPLTGIVKLSVDCPLLVLPTVGAPHC